MFLLQNPFILLVILEHMSKSISVVIPAYKEERVLASSLRRILSYLKSKKADYEIIIVVDRSEDRTAEIAQDFSNKNKKIKTIINPKRMGKGYAVNLGVKQAKKDYILMCDADLATPIEELNKFWELEDFDIIIASRNLPASRILAQNQSRLRSFLGKCFALIVGLILSVNVKDTQCGFKLFKKKVAKDIFRKQQIFGFAFDAEILYIAKKKGYKVKELPVIWKQNGKHSTVNPIKDSICMLKDVIKIKINSMLGRY